MRRKKKINFVIPLLMMLIILILAGLSTCFFFQWQQKDEEPKNQTLTVIQLNTEDIREISYTDSENIVTMKRKKGIWQRPKKPDFPLDQSYAERVVKAFCQITATGMVANPDYLPNYGLMSPMYTITLMDKRKNKTVVKIGNMANASDYYLTADEGKTIYTVDGNLIGQLVFDENQLLQKDTFPEINGNTLRSIVIARNGKKLVVCPNKGKDDAENLTTYGDELSTIHLDECVSYNTKKDKLKDYGLHETYRKEVTVVYEDAQTKLNKTQVFYMGKVFQEDGIDYVYMQLIGSKMVYKVYLSAVEKLIGA